MSSELVAILEKEASAELERIQSEARAQAAGVVAEARKAAQAYLEAQRARIDAERRAARMRAQSAAQVRASALVLQAKDRAIEEVFARAEDDLARIHQNKAQYAAALRGLIKEAAAGLGSRVVVEVHPQDLDLARQAVRELGLDAEVRAAGGVSGGARLATVDARFVVENTLSSRVARARPLIASEVAALLWGH